MRNVRMPPSTEALVRRRISRNHAAAAASVTRNHGIDIGDRRQLDLSRNELCDGTLARLGRRGDNAQLDVGDDTADDCRKQRDADRLRDVVASEDSGSEIGEPARNGGDERQKSAMRR